MIAVLLALLTVALMQAAVRAATTEHTQLFAVVSALGYTAAQLWGKMVA